MVSIIINIYVCLIKSLYKFKLVNIKIKEYQLVINSNKVKKDNHIDKYF